MAGSEMYRKLGTLTRYNHEARSGQQAQNLPKKQGRRRILEFGTH